MSQIQILPNDLRNKIAAGEVVERPASVLKELIENAIDAGGRKIEVEIEQGGHKSIRVTDDGHGMDRDDAMLSFERHATSKLRNESDLETIQTLGFRGEAIPSIASVARVRLVTAGAGSSDAVEIQVEGGNLKDVKETVSPSGTLFEVSDLFFNTPARKKFMRSPVTEFSHCMRLFQKISLPHYWIHFKLRHNGKQLADMPATNNARDRLFQSIGQDWMDQLLEISGESEGVWISGYVSKPPFSFSSRDHQEIFVNRRAIRSPLVSHALTEAYHTSMMKGRHPAAYLYIDVPQNGVDVNIHPSKREVRFQNQQHIHNLLRDTIRQGLRNSFQDHPVTTEPFPRYDMKSGGIPFETSVGESRARYISAQEAPLSVQKDAFESIAVPLGQMDQTYIVALLDRELMILDQHAAHERILFDRLTEQMDGHGLEMQPLLFPETIELPESTATHIRNILPVLKDAGIEIEEFGPRTFLIRSLPALLGRISGHKLLVDLAEDLGEDIRPDVIGRPIQTVLASIACHSAVKAHQSLGIEQMRVLLRDLQGVKAPTCPHGRPIRKSFSLSDLEKLFYRK